MSRYGRLLLRRVRLQYCDHTTPSQGLRLAPQQLPKSVGLAWTRHPCFAALFREYLQDHLSEFKQQNPHVNVETFMKRGKFPYIHAEYCKYRSAAAVSACAVLTICSPLLRGSIINLP